jgi:hypothetical protein
MKANSSHRAKTTAGVLLSGTGTLFFCQEIVHAFEQIRSLFVAPDQGLPTLVVAGWRLWQAFTGNHQLLLQAVVQQALVLSSVLLLLMAGNALSREEFVHQQVPCGQQDRITSQGRLK